GVGRAVTSKATAIGSKRKDKPVATPRQMARRCKFRNRFSGVDHFSCLKVDHFSCLFLDHFFLPVDTSMSTSDAHPRSIASLSSSLRMIGFPDSARASSAFLLARGRELRHFLSNCSSSFWHAGVALCSVLHSVGTRGV